MVGVARGGGIAAAVCGDEELRVWSLPDQRPVCTIDIRGRMVDASALSPDGKWLLAGDHAGIVSMWATAGGKLQWRATLRRYLAAAVFAPDGKRVAVAPMGDPVQILATDTGHKLGEMEAVVGGTAAIAFSLRWRPPRHRGSGYGGSRL
jgi:WD40 repeat protein